MLFKRWVGKFSNDLAIDLGTANTLAFVRGLFKRWVEKFSNDLAIDLGTANTLVFVRGDGIVINEPSVVAIQEADQSIIAVGRGAKAMLGRTPGNIRVIRPLKEGVIADFDVTEQMLSHFIAQGHRWHRTILRPRVVVGVPSGITQVEQRAVRDAALHAGARAVYLVEEPVAAAMGAGLSIHEPGGNLIVDIGGGTTEVAVLSLAGVIYCKSVRIAGDQMDEAIQQHIRKHHNLLIGERRAEEIKINLGSAYLGEGEQRTMDVKGRDLVGGFPKSVVVTEDEIREALRESVMTIVETVRTCLEQTPPELAADIVDTGIVITGGGGLLRGLDRLLATETQLPVTVAKDPMSCVALGVGRVLDELDLLKKVALPA
jgi:rod shape-determining protein MreB and related proteins